jgi:hypothetical protein
VNLLSFIFYLQEHHEEPFEINLALPLMGLVFCGLPIFLSVLILNVFIRRLRNREDHFSQWVISKEQQAEEEKNKTTDQQKHYWRR